MIARGFRELSILTIQTIELTRPILSKTFEFLRMHGKHGNESHALWVGENYDGVLKVSDVWFPQQYNSPIEYVVPEEEIHRLNVKLNQSGLAALAQIHTHPGEAFHSSVDNDGSALLVLPGVFSIVIPDYGFVKEDDPGIWALYQYDGRRWKKTSDDKEAKRRLFRII
ncbi:MAG: hypothetical protein QXJ74_01620 [Nitrososphaera sp.]